MKKTLIASMLVLNNIFNPAHKLFSKSSRRKRKGMAMILPGGGVADIRGSIGGTVFSRNRYGNYARNRTIPVNPNSASQQKIRSCISQIRDAWYNTLTAAQRADWAVYANNVPMVNRLGQSINLTGYGMFTRTALAQAYNDLALITDSPTVFSLAEQDETFAIVCSEAAQTIACTFDDTAEWCDEEGAALLIYASRPQNSTVNFFKGPYRLAGKIEGDSVTPPTSGDTVSAPFAFVENQKVFVQARILRADGRLSEPFRVAADCAA